MNRLMIGQKVRIRGRGDLGIGPEARSAIGMDGEVVKETSGGKYLVEMSDHRVFLFAKRNLEVL